jgi:DNA-binding response OmpR family regulator
MSDERLTALVLAADDDEDILELVRIVLEEDGYEVVTAPDGKKAIEMAAELTPDLCVFDVMMPKMDGCEATRRMRADDRMREIPILLLSARTQWEAVMQGKEAGADEYITKPFVPDDLQRSVRSLLAAPTPPVEDPVLGMVEGGIEPVTAADPAPPTGLVLVAGADANLVKLVGYRLELGGFEVATAHDAAEAAQLASERSPDLCVLDATIPPIDGLPVKWVDPSVSVHELYLDIERTLDEAGARRAVS